MVILSARGTERNCDMVHGIACDLLSMTCNHLHYRMQQTRMYKVKSQSIQLQLPHASQSYSCGSQLAEDMHSTMQ